jgi:A/G-specific adenine glycosylase
VARELPQALDAWFLVHGRRFPWRDAEGPGVLRGDGRLDPWRLLLTEVCLQQTRAERVADFLEGFFARFPDAASIRASEVAELEQILRPLGLHRRRARKLRALAEAIGARGDVVPLQRDDLDALPGVGHYVAAAVRCVLLGVREATLDVNMARVLERAIVTRSHADLRRDEGLRAWARLLAEQAPDARRFNWGMLDLGAMVCTARKPRCGACPVREWCHFGGTPSTS